MNYKKKMNWWATLAAIAVFVAGPAAAVPGLGWFSSDFVSGNNSSPRTATAFCPAGQQVISGGVAVNDGTNQVVLTRLEPIHGSTRDRYVASAEARFGFEGTWSLQAYAICANPLAGYQIVSRTVSPTPLSATFAATAAVCPSGKRVIGTGSRILNSRGVVGLQLSRASGPLDISRSTARERSNTPINWSLTSYAICANPVGLQEESGVVANARLTKHCSTGKLHSGGGGAGLVDSGPVFLKEVFVDPFLDFVSVEMTGVPTVGMVAQAICGP
jgi:hypothetical protein